MNDWVLFGSIIAILISLIALLDRLSGKSLSLREHEEFKSTVHRDHKRIEERIAILEQTRPSNEQLKDATVALKELMLRRRS